MTGSPLKLALIVAAAVVGIVVLATAFQGPSPIAGPGPVALSVPPSEDGLPPINERTSPPPAQQGTEIAVFNGTAELGLAGKVEEMLVKRGYVAAQLGDSVDSFSQTTIYYKKTRDKTSADALNAAFFQGGAVVEQLPAGVEVSVGGVTTTVDKDARVAIFLGDDYLKK